MIRSLLPGFALFAAACAQTPAAPATPADTETERPVVQMSVEEAACRFAQSRVSRFTAQAGQGVRQRISSQWLTLDLDEEALRNAISQADRERGPNAPYGMGYRPEFAAAIEGQEDWLVDRLYSHVTTPGPIDCHQIDTGAEPFTDDLSGFMAWADGQMMNPDPGAPDAAETLAISRPIHFQDGRRVMVAESYSYTPIPISRPPSAHLAIVVYELDEDGSWTHAASILLARAG